MSNDILHDPRSQRFLQDIEDRDLAECALKHVHTQDRSVVMRWLMGKTTEAIALEDGLSKQRIAQMKDRALERARRTLEMAS